MKTSFALTIATVALTVGAAAQDKEVTLIAPGGMANSTFCGFGSGAMFLGSGFERLRGLSL